MWPRPHACSEYQECDNHEKTMKKWTVQMWYLWTDHKSIEDNLGVFSHCWPLVIKSLETLYTVSIKRVKNIKRVFLCTLSWRKSTTFLGPMLNAFFRYELSCCCSTMWPAIGGDWAGTEILEAETKKTILRYYSTKNKLHLNSAANVWMRTNIFHFVWLTSSYFLKAQMSNICWFQHRTHTICTSQSQTMNINGHKMD